MTSRQARRYKEKFLGYFREYGNVTTAASLARIPHRSIIYDWQEQDDQFAAAFREAEIMATETLEHEARRRAVEGVTTETPIYAHGQLIDTAVETKYSDTLLIFLLKARAPEKYRDRIGVEHSGNIGSSETDLDARISAELAKMVTGSQSPLALAAPGETRAAHPTG